MSTGAQVAVLDGRGVRRTRLRSDPASLQRPGVRLAAFAALGLYGTLRWGTMLSPVPGWRMLGLLVLAVLLAAAGPPLKARSVTLTTIVVVLAVLAAFPLAGLPLSWVRHVRLAVGADAIDAGLSALPRAFVPYAGINQSVRLVVVLGAGFLLLLGALPLAFASRSPGQLRRAAAALPLTALAIVPATLARPQVAYLHGLILFALLAAFFWGERIARYDVPLAVGIMALAGAAGMIAAPALDRQKPWFDYQALAGRLSPGHIEAFDWSQRYGPLNWPRTGREVLDVAATHPDYWKAENLELFTGIGWSAGSTDYGAQPPAPSPGSINRWSQTIQVTLRSMRTQQVVAAGFSGAPVALTQPVAPGLAAGTWTVPSQLQPGDSYRVTTYSPRPTLAALAQDTAAYPATALRGELSILLSQAGLPGKQIVFAPLTSGLRPVDAATGSDAHAALAASPYGRVYALALRLRQHARTPAAYVASVVGYLGRGFTYSENPPPSRYPLASFLLRDKAGYCQQFAGAMALLLRMGGVPARVAAGFTTGNLDRSRNQYVVSDLDAHAWVEAWFPRYGWVRFDPTPRSAPARSGRVALPAIRGSAAPAAPLKPIRRAGPVTAAAPVVAARHAGGGQLVVPIALAGAALLALLTLLLAFTVRLREPGEQELVAELARAMARCGRPLRAGATLAMLERRFSSSPGAAGYIGAIRMMRFAGAREPPTPAQRRALRGQLRAGLGLLGRLRATWALPPRWTLKSRRSGHPGAYTDGDGRRI